MAVDFQQLILRDAVRLIEPVRAAGGDPLALENLLWEVGWTRTVLERGGTAEALRGIGDDADRLIDLVLTPPESLADAVRALGVAQRAFERLEALARAVGDAVQASGGDAAAAGQLIEDVANSLVLSYLRGWRGTLHASLALLTIVRYPDEVAPVPAVTGAGGTELRRPVRIGRLEPARIGRVLTRPAETLRQEYLPRGLADDAAAAAAADRLFPRLAELAVSLGANAAYRPEDRGLRVEVGPHGAVELFLTAAQRGVRVVPPPALRIEGLDIAGWGVDLTLDAAGPFVVDARGVVGGARPSARLRLRRGHPGHVGVRVGSWRGSRLELGALELTGAFDPTPGRPRYELSALASGGRLVLDLGDADGFLRGTLPRGRTDFAFDAGIGWANDRGVFLRGGAGLEVVLPTNATLGGVAEVVYVAVRIDARERALAAAALAGIRLRLGPLTALIDRVGGALEARFDQRPANLGIAHLEPRFVPPNGVGLSVDAPLVRGGGMLRFDTARAQYAGVLELQLASVGVKAVGLLTTRLPDGRDGFSLVLILTANFAPIQLGFGFTLNGVGGVLGINRTMDVDRLRAGLRAGTLGSILFPPDPVRNAQRIVADLREVFPPAEGRHVIGPMVKLGWGSPTLLTADLGVIVELPPPIRIAILGRLSALLPSAEKALVRLNMDVLGLIEPERKSLSIDAVLFDSRVLAFALEGEMAFRLHWGAQPSFALSVGGLHPRFRPPPGLPQLRRLTLSLGEAANPRLSCASYFAVTSNTLQFGARVELRASAGEFSVRGHLGFDVLFVRSPFSFEADMSASVEVLAGSAVLMSVNLDFTLSGPTPWRARGRAKFRVLLLEVSVGFDVSWGSRERAELPSRDPLAPLRAALADPGNWSAELPAATELGISLAPSEAVRGRVLVHPVGQLTVRQKVVPLGRAIERFGATTPARWRRFWLAGATLGGPAQTHPVQDMFARGQLFALSQEEQISSPSFEAMPSGATLRPAPAPPGRVVGAQVAYQTDVLDKPEEPPLRLRLRYVPPPAAFTAQVRIGAAALSPIAESGPVRFADFAPVSPVSVLEAPTYVVGSTVDLSARTDVFAGAGTYGEALGALRRHLALRPSDRDRLQVLASHELAGR